MGFFNRRSRPADANTAAAVAEGPDTTREKHGRRGIMRKNERRPTTAGAGPAYGNGHLNARPRFGQWLKATWLDFLTMVIMGAIGLGVYEAPPAPSRSFPVYEVTGELANPNVAYPLRKNIIPIYAAALLASLIPIFIILSMQLRIRSFWDVNNAIIGLLYSLITAAVFQVFVKWLIGGLRPHFLDVCQPAVPAYGDQAGKGFAHVMYDKSVCTGDPSEINDSLESMPSGHSTAAFAGFIFLYLYLNAKLKVFSNYHPAMWKLIVLYMPVLGACLIAGSLTIDEFHHWYDVLAGAVIGTVMAFSAYRMVYASVWDFRFNHIPLVRHIPFTYGEGSACDTFHNAIWTRQAGWGTTLGGGTFGGAPFDAAAMGAGGTAAQAAALGGAGASAGQGGHRRGLSADGRRSAEQHRRRGSVPRKPVPISPAAAAGTGNGAGVFSRRGDDMV